MFRTGSLAEILASIYFILNSVLVLDELFLILFLYFFYGVYRYKFFTKIMFKYIYIYFFVN